MINNPYISQVQNHPKILTDLEIEIFSKKWKWQDYFWNNNKIVLEIGSGLGNYFSKRVNEELDKNFIAIELRYKRCFLTAEKCLWNKKNNDNSKDNTKLEKYNPNFVVLKVDARHIDKIFWENELDEIVVFFPDPWARKKSWVLKKRLLRRDYLNKLYNITKSWWKFLFKTDHLGYFLHVLQEIEFTKWKLIFKTFDYEKEWLYESNSITEFEQIFRGQNLKICYLELEKK
jgi:tRNA (guanine-N7-)-methyltransferase